MINIMDVARYFIEKCNNNGIQISNMKLQKLCYYAQGLSLAINNDKLFSNDIEAWEHGPVIRELYTEFRSFGKYHINSLDKSFHPKGKAKETLDLTYNSFAIFSAWKLREMSHEERPWEKNYKAGYKTTISDDEIKTFFKDIISDDDITSSALSLSRKVIKQNKKALEILADR